MPPNNMYGANGPYSTAGPNYGQNVPLLPPFGNHYAGGGNYMSRNHGFGN